MSRPLRIALLTHSVRPRGGVVHTLELADALQARGHTVTVIASAEPGEQLFRAVDLAFHTLALPALSGDLLTQVGQRIHTLVQGLPALLAGGDFDVLHAQDSLSGNALALLQAEGVVLAPWVRTVHHLDVFDDPTLMAWQTRAWRAADDVACVSDSWAAHFHTVLGVRAQRMFNGVNLQRYRRETQPGDAALLGSLGVPAQTGPLCLLVGGVEQRKNTTRLLHAFAHLRQHDPAWAEARLVVAGGASMLDHSGAHRTWAAALAEHALREGPGQAVLRTGPLPDAALPALMRRADVLAMPSLMEGFGLAALEALACGTPVLVSARPPFTEHLSGEPGVSWCEPEDIASIATGLRQAAVAPRLQHTPGVCLQHSWSRSAALHEAWYAQRLARRAHAAATALESTPV
ncbi:glycosyltransferase-like protein [Sphaerotilus hippei]|uniref:Glycosyltransferase-like protein n=1 Tax=Sphaerotilus hippei TaxID=744406 RepID=A0A318H397_9BURK|nr:glycosyltransferase-like protein [Sphaerotilus hippei]